MALHGASAADTDEKTEVDHGSLPAPVVAAKVTEPAAEPVTKPSPADEAAQKPETAKDSQDTWYRRLAAKLSRKQWMMVAAVIVLLCAGATSYALTRPEDAKQSAAATKQRQKPKPKPAPPVIPVSPLTGLDVSAEDAKHVVTGVMIENSTNARPQSGLHQAGVVFEAIAEYGITRFLALYQEAKPGNLGPVRSVRPYYADWVKTYDAPIAHVGGSPDALAKIRLENIKDLDQFANAGAYRRIGQRFAPHNVYTTMAQLNETAAGKGWTTSKFTSFPRKKAAPAKVQTAKTIDIAISGPTYNVHYDYDVDNNRYLRVMAGEPHVDADSQERIAPKVVIGLVASYGLEPDGLHSAYQVTGTGKAFIFQDGIASEVTWTRAASGDQYVFADAAGKPFKLIPGQTWITVVGDPGAVTFAP